MSDTRKVAKRIRKNDSAEDILRRGRMNLIMSNPFFGELAMHLKLEKANWMPTIAVTADRRFLYNERFVKEFTTTDMMFEWGHEIGHLIFRHHARKSAGAIHDIWNLACDLVIDAHLIIDGGFGDQPEISRQKLTPEMMNRIRKPDGKIMSSEAVYRMLMQDMESCPACDAFIKDSNRVANGQMSKEEFVDKLKKGGYGENVEAPDPSCGHGQNPAPKNSEEEADQILDRVEESLKGDGKDYKPHVPNTTYDGHKHKDTGHPHIDGRMCGCGSMQEASKEEVDEWRQKMVSAAHVAKDRGKMPAIAQDFLVRLTKPSLSWQNLIRSKGSQIFRGRYTLKRPSRRAHSLSARLPRNMPRNDPAVVVLDTSGSIGENMISKFMSETVGILKASGAPFVYMYFHDTHVYHEGMFTKDMMNKIKVTHGGTSHVDVWKKIEEKPKLPGMIVFLTDLYSDHNQLKNLGVPTIWVHPAGRGDECEIPFGRKISIPDSYGDAK